LDDAVTSAVQVDLLYMMMMMMMMMMNRWS